MSQPNHSRLFIVDRAASRTLVCHHGIIEAIEPTISHHTERADTLDGTNLMLSPGRVNAHTHIYSGLAPFNMPVPPTTPKNFVEILESIWWKLDRALDAASLRAAAEYYVANALLYGTTALVDHHESPLFIEGSLDVIADVCQTLGIRARLCFGATERNDGLREAQRGLNECARFIRENRRSLVSGMVGLHASFTVSDDTIRSAGELCRTLNVPLHIHLAEDLADVTDARDRGYRGPLDRLIALDALPQSSILAHGVHLTRDEVVLATEKQSWFVQNPRSNRGNRVGYPLELSVSHRVALGTDGYPADMLAETTALVEEATRHRDPALQQIALRAARSSDLFAEQVQRRFTPIAPGAVADLILTKQGKPYHVVVDGNVVVRQGVLVNGDFSRIQRNAELQAQQLWQRMAALS